MNGSEMTLRTCLIAVVAFGLGFLAHFAISRIPVDKKAQEIAYHWRRINDFRDYMRNPRNQEDFGRLSGVTEPYSPEPSLAALVAAGELEHVDLVLPSVPSNRTINLHWMLFCEDRREKIIYALGNSEYAAFSPSGVAPFHMKLWFKKSATADIQQLIRELEALAASETQQSNDPASANP